MKEIMLVAIGVGCGFAICGCLMFWVMASIAKGNQKKNKFDEITIELMRERNRCDWLVEAHLRHIANYTSPQEQPLQLAPELRVYLDELDIHSDNIGDIRRACFVPWSSSWNSLVRDETASRERPPTDEKKK